MAALGHRDAVAEIMGVRLTGFPAWWLRRTYYLLQMPRWERRLRIVLDWSVALRFRPDITKVDLAVEWDQTARNAPAGATRLPAEPTTPGTTVRGADGRMAAR
jgi:NADH dehydrogenase